ncbi:MAG: histidinol dehydrogenase [Alphaproteobacteria bacterium]
MSPPWCAASLPMCAPRRRGAGGTDQQVRPRQCHGGTLSCRPPKSMALARSRQGTVAAIETALLRASKAIEESLNAGGRAFHRPTPKCRAGPGGTDPPAVGVGLYVPRRHRVLSSSVLMNAISAEIAGDRHIVVVHPPAAAASIRWCWRRPGAPASPTSLSHRRGPGCCRAGLRH